MASGRSTRGSNESTWFLSFSRLGGSSSLSSGVRETRSLPLICSIRRSHGKVALPQCGGRPHRAAWRGIESPDRLTVSGPESGKSKVAPPPKPVPGAVWLADLPSAHCGLGIHPACASHRADAPKHKRYRIFGPDFHLAAPPTAAKAESALLAVHLEGLPCSSLHVGSETPMPPKQGGPRGYPQNGLPSAA